MLTLALAAYLTGTTIFSVMVFILTAGFPSHSDNIKLWAFAVFWPIMIPVGIAKAMLERF